MLSWQSLLNHRGDEVSNVDEQYGYITHIRLLLGDQLTEYRVRRAYGIYRRASEANIDIFQQHEVHLSSAALCGSHAIVNIFKREYLFWPKAMLEW